MNLFVRIFMTIWFSGVILIGGAVFTAAIAMSFAGAPPKQNNAWVGMVVPPAMLVFGFVLVRVGGYLAREEPRFLTDFLIQTLDAHQAVS